MSVSHLSRDFYEKVSLKERPSPRKAVSPPKPVRVAQGRMERLRHLYQHFIRGLHVTSRVRCVANPTVTDIKSLRKALDIFHQIEKGKTSISFNGGSLEERDELRSIMLHMLVRKTGRVLVRYLIDSSATVKIEPGAKDSHCEYNHVEQFAKVRVDLKIRYKKLFRNEEGQLDFEELTKVEVLAHELIHAAFYAKNAHQKLKRIPFINKAEEIRWGNYLEKAVIVGLRGYSLESRCGSMVTESQISHEMGLHERLSHVDLPSHYEACTPGNAKNRTLLMCAASLNQTDIARMLLRLGEDVHAEDVRGKTALHLAAALASREMVRLFIDAGADPEHRSHSGATASGFAIFNHNIETLCILLKDVNASGHIGESKSTALHFFARDKYEKGTHYLLERGVDVIAKSDSGSYSSEIVIKRDGYHLGITLGALELQKLCDLGDVEAVLEHHLIEDVVEKELFIYEGVPLPLLHYAYKVGQFGVCRALISNGITSIFSSTKYSTSLFEQLHELEDYRLTTYFLHIQTEYFTSDSLRESGA